MKHALFYLVALVLMVFRPLAETRAQPSIFSPKKDTYHFDRPEPEIPARLPEAVPGRLHLLDGSTIEVPLVFLDYNKVVAVDLGTRQLYTPLEVSSFVMKQDSFVVLKDFKVAVGEDEQEYRIAFVRVGAVGPDFALYHFRGTMRRDNAVQYVGSAPRFNGATWSGGGATAQSDATVYEMSQTWFMKRTNEARWQSLPKSGGRIRTIVEPIIADDAALSKSVSWTFMNADKLPRLLNEYIAHKKAGLQ